MLAVIHLAVCIPFLGSHSLDLDEPFSVFHAQHDLDELFHLFSNENNPPLHFVALHFWIKLFGTDAVAVRSLSLLFSVLTIPILFRLGYSFVNRKAGILFCLLFIASDFHHYHALEARPYSMFVLLFSGTLLMLFSALKSGSTKHYVFIGLLSALLFYTHYISIYALPFIFLVLMLQSARERVIKKSFLTLLVFGLAVTPWIPVFMVRLENVSEVGSWVPRPHVTELYGLINKFFNDKWSFIVLLATTVTLIRLNVRDLRRHWTELRLVIVSVSVIFVGTYLLCFVSSFFMSSVFLDRYLFFLTIPLFLLTSLLFATLRYGLVMFSVFFTIFLIRFDITPRNNRNTREIATDVQSANPSAIYIVPHYFDLAFVYHYKRQLFERKRASEFRKAELESHIFRYGYDELPKMKSGQKLCLVAGDFEFERSRTHILAELQSSGYRLIDTRNFPGNYQVLEFIAE